MTLLRMLEQASCTICIRLWYKQGTQSDNSASIMTEGTAVLPIFDTHAHLDFPQFQHDQAALLRRLKTGTFPGGLTPEELNEQKIEVVGVIVPGIDAKGANTIKRLDDGFAGLAHFAVGIHPNYTANTIQDDWKIIAEVAQRDDIVAVGETGLDRHWDEAPIDIQTDIFQRHIELSQETGKPILIHCRDAWDDVLAILYRAGKLNGVIHAFSGNTEQMQQCVELGFYISFAGSVTYRNAKFAPLWEAARQTPLDRLLIETDAPFMLPHPYRGKLPQNEPTLAALTALRLAELRGESLQTIAEATASNAFRLLGLKC